MSRPQDSEDFIRQVEIGLQEIEEGKTIPLKEVKKIIEGWPSDAFPLDISIVN